ncbi:MAG: aminotransferase class IV [Opitutaceae bacterium]
MGAAFIQANTNGRLHDAQEASLPPLNRGFLYGDAIYEVWRTYQNVLFAWEEHWRRLEKSARALHIGIPMERDAMFAEIRRTARVYRTATDYAGELYVRLQITRGAGAIGLDTALADRPDYVILVQPNKDIPDAVRTGGYRLSLETTLRRNASATLNPAWKTGNYLNNVMCLREARARGADDVVMVNLAGEITEASASNLGFIRGSELFTPPLAAGILGGITRDLIVTRIAAQAGLKVREETLVPDDLAHMDESFIMSTTRDVAPVGHIDEHVYRVGAGTQTATLKAAFAGHVADYNAAHPQQVI